MHTSILWLEFHSDQHVQWGQSPSCTVITPVSTNNVQSLLDQPFTVVSVNICLTTDIALWGWLLQVRSMRGSYHLSVQICSLWPVELDVLHAFAGPKLVVAIIKACSCYVRYAQMSVLQYACRSVPLVVQDVQANNTAFPVHVAPLAWSSFDFAAVSHPPACTSAQWLSCRTWHAASNFVISGNAFTRQLKYRGHADGCIGCMISLAWLGLEILHTAFWSHDMNVHP